MELEQQLENGVMRLKVLERRLDARTAAGLKDKMAELIQAGNWRIALDLSQVQFVDSSGLGAIVSARKQLGSNGDLVIGGACDTLLSMFKLTRLDKVFRIFNQTDDAVAALRQ
ncbi:MAG: anti-anti-sigma factor [Acidobacteria bacterium RBG_16_68_9]|nr:MAG: anti-anti-sigma factor [Acidobacteria bacterium RBG_16_68_9]